MGGGGEEMDLQHTGMVKKVGPMSCDPASSIPPAAEVSSRNLGCTFMLTTV